MIPIRRLRQSILLCLAAICAALMLSSPAWSQSDDNATEAAQPANTPKRPILPEDAEKHVAELEERIEELKKAGGDDGLAKAIELAEEVLSVRLEHQGPGSGWTTTEGKQAEWYEVGDTRRVVEDLIFRGSLNTQQRGELNRAQQLNVQEHELYQQGCITQAVELHKMIMDIHLRILGKNHPTTLDSMYDMGFLLWADGKFDDAEQYTREALEIRKHVLGDDHPSTLDSIDHMGALYFFQRRYAEAEPYLRAALEGNRRVLGDDHSDTLTSINNMGKFFESQAKFKEAESYLTEALDDSRRVMGNDHPGTLISINNMGALLFRQGRYAEAEPYWREALESRHRILGDDHPDTLTVINNMAILLDCQGRLAQAEPYYRQALESSRRVLGDDHPETLITIHNMGFMLKDQGQYSEAELYFREALEGNRRVLGDDHRGTLTSLNGMGAFLFSQGRYAEAEPYSRGALEGRRRTLGDDHQDTLAVINNMGFLLESQRRYTEAEPYYREALEGRRRVLGDDHQDTLVTIHNMGTLFKIQGRYAEAEPYFRKALAGRRRVLGEDHQETAASSNGLGRLLYDKGDYAEAEAMWTEAANSFEKARLQVSFSGLERVQFAANKSPLIPLAACLARNGKALLAWRQLEGNFARGLLDTLSTRHARPLDSSERSNEEDLIGQLNKLDERINTLLEMKDETEESRTKVKQLRNERERLQAELAKFENEMSDKYGVAAGEVYPLSLVQAQLPEDTALLAWVDIKGAPHAADPNGGHWACVVRCHGEPMWVKLPGSSKDGAWTELDDKLAHQLRKELGHWSAGPSVRWRQGLIQQLHAQRIAPVELHLAGIRHMIILPAGKMAGIPVEALTDDYTISYAPSGTMYAWLREKAPKARPTLGDSGYLLALGDPVFPKRVEPGKPLPEPPGHGVLVAMVAPESNALRSGLQEGDVLLSYGGSELGGPDELGPAIQQAQKQESDTGEESEDKSTVPISVWREGETLELAVAPGKLGVRPAQQPAPEAILTQRRLDEVMSSTRSASFNPIPHTRGEVETIAGMFTPAKGEAETGDQSLILLGSEASEQRLHALAEADELKKYRYLHLATHGVMDDNIAMNSAMILSQDNLPDAFEQAVAGEEIYDGRLTAEQIVRTWKLDADLVALSGCETALGEDSGGEGFLGFSQALFVAGARSLVLSLWKVDDTATMLLMTRFYQNMLGRYVEVRSIPDHEYSAGTPMPKAEALREAKMWLRSLTSDQLAELELEATGSEDRGTIRRSEPEAKPTAHHPYEDPQFWASFILIGDPG